LLLMRFLLVLTLNQKILVSVQKYPSDYKL
jgi:hypothetical protein